MFTFMAVLGVTGLACLVASLFVSFQVRDRLDRVAELLEGANKDSHVRHVEARA